jgi:diadenylate cyclase
MTASLFTSLGSIFAKASLAGKNILDIVLIAILIYLVIRLLRETQSLPVLVGVLTLTVLYGLTYLVDLPLTHFVLQSFFAAFLVLIAIIFQRELRRFFSVFGVWGVNRRFVPPNETTVDIIVRSVRELVKRKLGAIIVFPGREPIDRLIEGGYRLNGEISEPLLVSIFDDTSPGHDGAAIIDNNRIRRFAVHLPLAENIQKVKQFGTRHRAALGLSERSDALVLVVSEERGKISLMNNGNMHAVFEGDELRRVILDFLQEKFPRRTRAQLRTWLGKNIGLLLVSMALAFSVWLFVNAQFVLVQRNFVVPLEFKNLPMQYTISDTVPQETVVTLQGRSSDLDTLRGSGLKATIDLGSINREGWHQILIEQTDISTPYNTTILKIDPEGIRVDVSQGRGK